jgi:hypothetical protein
MEEQDEEALFDRLAKNLEAVRQDAALARSQGVEGLSTGLARAEAAVQGLAADHAALRERVEQQHTATVRLEAAGAKAEADTERMRQTINELSRRLCEQAGLQGGRSRLGRWVRGATRTGLLVVALLLSGAALWTANGWQPALGPLVHQAALRFTALTGLHVAGWGEPAAVAQATARPDAGPQSPGAVAASTAAPSVAPPPAAPSVATAESPAAASGPAVAAAAPTVAAASMPSSPAVQPAPEVVQAAPEVLLGPAATEVANPALTASVTPVHLPAAGAVAAAPPAAPSAQPAAVPPSAETAAALAPPPVHATVATQALPAPAPAALSGAAASSAATSGAAAAAPRQIVLHATADTWVQVHRANGPVLMTRTMRAGDVWSTPTEPGLILETGNVNGLAIEIDGLPIHLSGAKGIVLHNVPLDASLLPSGAPAHH